MFLFKKSAQKLVFFVFLNLVTSLLRNLGLNDSATESQQAYLLSSSCSASCSKYGRDVKGK